MGETIRERIIQEFMTRSAVIRNTASPPAFATDIGATVIRARKDIDPAEPPCCVVWPRTEAAENKNGMVLHRMPVQVDGIAYFGAEDPSVVAERILGDIIQCFTARTWDRRRLVTSPASPITYLEPYASGIVYTAGGTDEYPDAEHRTIGAYATFTVTYWTRIGDPCSQ